MKQSRTTNQFKTLGKESQWRIILYSDNFFLCTKAKSLAREDLAKPELSVRIAQKTAEYHRLQLPLCKDPDYLWNTISE